MCLRLLLFGSLSRGFYHINWPLHTQAIYARLMVYRKVPKISPSIYKQAFRQDSKSGCPNCTIGPAQMGNFIRQHMKNKTSFFKWPSSGRLDTHLAKNLCMSPSK